MWQIWMAQSPCGDLKKVKLAGTKATEIVKVISGMSFLQRQGRSLGHGTRCCKTLSLQLYKLPDFSS